MMDNSISAIIETQLIGIIRVTLTLPLEHSLDRLKTHMQQRHIPISAFKSFLEVKNQGLFRGLLAGFKPNWIRCILKQYYRWPMMILIPTFFQQRLPSHSRLLSKVLTGITIALFESLIICPLERLKIYRMTNLSTSGHLLCRIPIVNQGMIGFLYTGFQLQVLRQVVSWTTFLFWEHKIRFYFKGSSKDALTFTQLTAASFLNSLINIAVVQPFDTIKTLYQMKNNQQYVDQSILRSFKDIYQKNGINALYAGWQMRILAFFAQAMLTTPTIDYLENKYSTF